MDACCAPGSGRSSRAPAPMGAGGAHPATLVELNAGTFKMGDESHWAYPGDGEGPVHEVSLSHFAIDRYTVTNEAFAAFVEATGFVTEAETFGWSFVFEGFLPEGFPDTRAVVGAEWWRQVMGASWRHPEGPRSYDRSAVGPPSGPRVLGRCDGVLRVVRHAIADGGGVGVCGSRGFARAISLGRRARARRRAPHERLPRSAFLTRTSVRTDSWERRPSMRSLRMRSACTTSREMCGNGVPTGTTRVTTRGARVTTRTARWEGRAA